MSHRRDAVIVDAVRTPVGKRNGGLSGVTAIDLSAHVLNALADRTGIDPALVDDVIWGCVSQVGEQTFDIARTAVLAAGWPESVPGTTVDRQCGSSQQAVHFAAAGRGRRPVRPGRRRRRRVDEPACRWAPCGSPSGPPFGRVGYASATAPASNQGIGAEMIAEQLGPVPRRSSTSSRSPRTRRPRAAIDEGRFDGRDRPGRPAGRHSRRHRRGRPPRRHAREAGHAQAGVQARTA